MRSSITFLLLLLLRSNTTSAHLKGAHSNDSEDSTTIALSNKKSTTRAIIKREAPSAPEAIKDENKNRRLRQRKQKRPSPEEMCSAFMIYDYLTRRMERESRNLHDGADVDIDWSSACPPMHDLNPHICPYGKDLRDICNSQYRVDLNPSVKFDYCEPLLQEIEDEQDRTECVRACVRYVSRDRGDCCQFECEEEVRMR